MLFAMVSFVGTVVLIFSLPVLALGGWILHQLAHRRALNGSAPRQVGQVIESSFVDEESKSGE